MQRKKAPGALPRGVHKKRASENKHFLCLIQSGDSTPALLLRGSKNMCTYGLFFICVNKSESKEIVIWELASKAGSFVRKCVFVCTWIMEEVADRLKTYHCWRDSVVHLVFCSLYLTLQRAGTSVSVEEHVNMLKIHVFFFLSNVINSVTYFTATYYILPNTVLIY